MRIESYKDLIVWQRSMELVVAVYNLIKRFPKDEIYGLSLQMKRAAVSIASNIAEGSRRGSKKDFRHFLLNAFGSGSELETQLEIAKKLGFADNSDCQKIDDLLVGVMRMLNKICDKLNV